MWASARPGIARVLPSAGPAQRPAASVARQGHARLRRYLWVAATVAVRYDPALAAFRDRLRARGKSKHSALCAVMHELLRRMMGRLHAFYGPHQAILPSAA